MALSLTDDESLALARMLMVTQNFCRRSAGAVPDAVFSAIELLERSDPGLFARASKPNE